MNDMSAPIQSEDTAEASLERKLRERIGVVMTDPALQQSSELTAWNWMSLVLVALILPALILVWGWY